MSRYSAVRVVVGAILAGFAGMAAAADNQNLNLTANVLAVCKFQGAAKTVTFQDLDPSAGTNRTGVLSADVAYKCTKDTVISAITVGNGANHDGTDRRLRKGTTTDYIKYSLSVTAPNPGNGFGAASSDKAMVVSATIQGAAYQDVPEGTYTDTVQLSITP